MNSLSALYPKSTSLWNEFDVLFKDIFDHSMPFTQINQTKFHYPVDIKSSDKGIQIDVAIVGVDKKDVKIDMEDDILRVSYNNGDPLRADQSQNSGWIHRGITRKSFDFSWKISSKFDSNKIKAEMDKGILSITIPYSEEKQKRQIEVI
jgi:HSP20 family protein